MKNKDLNFVQIFLHSKTIKFVIFSLINPLYHQHFVKIILNINFKEIFGAYRIKKILLKKFRLKRSIIYLIINDKEVNIISVKICKASIKICRYI